MKQSWEKSRLAQVLKRPSDNFICLQRLWCFHFSFAMLMQVVNKNRAKAAHLHSKDTCYLINTLDWFPLHPLLFWYIVQDFISLFLQWSKGILASSGTTHLSVPIESKITGGHLYSTGNLRVYVSSQ